MVRGPSLKRKDLFSSSDRSDSRVGTSWERTSGPRSLKESSPAASAHRASVSVVTTATTERSLSRLRRPSAKPAARCGKIPHPFSHRGVRPRTPSRQPQAVLEPRRQRGRSLGPPTLSPVEFAPEEAEQGILTRAKGEGLLSERKDLLVGEPSHIGRVDRG